MALKRLSIEEMVERTSDLLSPETDEHKALVSFPLGKAMLPEIQSSYDGLIAAQPPNDSAIAALTSLLTQLDGDHDELVRAIFDRFQSEIRLALDDETRERLVRACDGLLPKGLATIQLSYAEQAGEAKLRAARVDDEIDKTLGKMKTYDGRTLGALYARLQETATEIGRQEKRRAQLGEEGARVARAGDARNQWIRTMNALAAVIAAARLDEAPILGRIRETEAKAERGAPPVSNPAVSNPVSSPTDLDPPVPGDADPNGDPQA